MTEVRAIPRARRIVVVCPECGYEPAMNYTSQESWHRHPYKHKREGEDCPGIPTQRAYVLADALVEYFEDAKGLQEAVVCAINDLR